jgi:hypothetical protein
VSEVCGRARVTEELRELVERGDLDSAGARELLLDAAHRGVRQHASVRTDHLLAVGMRRGLGIDVEGEKARHAGHRTRLTGERRFEHLVEVGCRVGTDEEDPSSALRERDRRRTGHARLADAALSREEEVSRSAFEEVHDALPQQQLAFDFAPVLGPQHPVEAAGATSSFFTTTPARAARVSREG